MKRFVLSLFFMTSVQVYADPPLNLSCVKSGIIHYYESGDYEKAVIAQTKKAKRYLLKRVAENNYFSTPKRLAMILDIDDTALSNYEWYKHDNFSNLPPSINQSYQYTKTPAVKPILALFNLAIKNHVDVFFISSRPNEVREKTIRTLHNAGYNHWTHLYLPTEKDNPSSKLYKLAIRKAITQQGYKIILNIGDQDNDFFGGYAEKTFKIPNPLYSTSYKGKLG